MVYQMKKTTQQISELYQKLSELSFEPEEWRRLSQLLLLKGSQTEHLQANHQLTPDSIGFLFVFLIEQLFPDHKRENRCLGYFSRNGQFVINSSFKPKHSLDTIQKVLVWISMIHYCLSQLLQVS